MSKEPTLELKAIIFDMDGVIADSEGYYDEVFQRWLRDHGIEETEEIYQEVLGRSWPAVFEYVEEQYKLGLDPQAEADAIADTIVSHIVEVGIPLMHDAEYALDQLGKKFTLALVSSSPRSVVERMLKHHGLYDRFVHITTVEDVKYPKPHPQPYAITMAVLGFKPEECIVIEDSLNGVKAGAAAGAFVYALPDARISLSEYHQHAKVVHTFDEILKDLL